ncbi:hypothetical protein HY413_03965 [Candidatus Kaiserbacteria bacterium]|nr:hypothetical protein [Candidatus Kaiserbacteria bacterium]
MKSRKLMLTLNPIIHEKLAERQRRGYGSVQEVINEILRKELLRINKVGRPPKAKKSMEDYLTR